MIDMTINLPTIVTLLFAVVGFTAWLVRMEGRVNTTAADQAEIEKKVDALAALVSLGDKQLAEYKTHVAETFVTKAGMAEQTDRIMKALDGVANRIEGLNSRLDTLYSDRPVGARRTRP